MRGGTSGEGGLHEDSFSLGIAEPGTLTGHEVGGVHFFSEGRWMRKEGESAVSPSPLNEAPTLPKQFLELLGLHQCPPFHRDRLFLIALASGPIFWVAWAMLVPVNPLPWSRLWSLVFFSVTVWQPLMEELFFRGLIQGQLGRLACGRRAFLGVTPANAVTSMFFVAGHWLTHPPLWALAVLIPSLLFGAMRDRFRSLYPAIVLHSFYNAGYFLLARLP